MHREQSEPVPVGYVAADAQQLDLDEPAKFERRECGRRRGDHSPSKRSYCVIGPLGTVRIGRSRPHEKSIWAFLSKSMRWFLRRRVSCTVEPPSSIGRRTYENGIWAGPTYEAAEVLRSADARTLNMDLGLHPFNELHADDTRAGNGYTASPGQ